MTTPADSDETVSGQADLAAAESTQENQPAAPPTEESTPATETPVVSVAKGGFH